MALSNGFGGQGNVLNMGLLSPELESHLVHPSPATGGGGAAGPSGIGGGVGGEVGGYQLLRPNTSGTNVLFMSPISPAPTGGGALNLTTTVVLPAISQMYSLPWMISVAVLLFLLTLITIFGNFLVVLALVKYHKLRSVSNYLIGNLAVSDFLLSVTILPMSVVNQCLGYWVFGEILCKFWLVADVLYCTASIWNLCIIAFDRFTATLYPLWYREKRTVKQGIVYIIIVWVLSFAICVPPLLGWNDFTQSYVYSNDTDTYSCVLFQTRGYVIYSASGSFYIPFLITLFLYIRIFGVLRHRIRKMRSKQNKNTTKSASKPAMSPSTGDKTMAMVTTTAGSTNNGSGSGDNRGKDGIELNAVGGSAGDGHAVVAAIQAEEASSKSLFGSDSAGDNRSEEDEDSTHARSDHPLYVSSSEAEFVTKNGVKPDSLKLRSANNNSRVSNNVIVQSGNNGTEPLVVGNNKYQTSSGRRESEKESTDHEHIQIVVTEDAGTLIAPNNNGKPGKNQKGLRNKLLSVSREVLHRTDSSKCESKSSGAAGAGGHGALGPRRSVNIGNALKHNPFKKDRDKSRSTSKQKRFDQREVRATIRMAIIIAFFCGCWLGFFIIYVVRAFCGPKKCVIPNDVDAFLFWLGYSNSAMNPILYTIFNDDFRKAFQKLLGCHVRNSGGSGGGRTKH